MHLLSVFSNKKSYNRFACTTMLKFFLATFHPFNPTLLALFRSDNALSIAEAKERILPGSARNADSSSIK